MTPEAAHLAEGLVALFLIPILLGVAYVVRLQRTMADLRAQLASRDTAGADQAEKLADARDRAVAASRAKSDFLATTSHEIRTALNGILGLSAVLATGKLQREQREMVGTIQASGDALRRLLDEILDTARIEAGKLELESISFDLGEVVEDVVDLFAAQANAKGLDLCAVVSRPATTRVLGDPHRVRQVISNLVGNAVKFTRKGDIVVRASIRDSKACVEVTDSGAGMTKEHLARLFVSFEQLDAARAREHGGTGLGLSICRHFARAMGGDVVAGSSEGLGTTFTFTWPADGASEEHDLRESTLMEVGGMRMLYVEAHAATRESFVALARSTDLLSSVCGSIDEALEVLSQIEHDVVLLGVRGIADAIAMAQSLRAWPNLPIVAVVSQPTGGVEATSHGITLTAMRPLRRSRLVALAAELRGSRAHTGGGTIPPPSRTRRALVIDDDPTNRRVARLLLLSMGWLADEAPSGEEGLLRANDVAYDAVFIDLHMPGIDGLETARRLRALPMPPSRLIAFTASVFDADKERTAAAGMRDFLAKPIDVGALRGLLERIERGLRRAEARAAGGSDAPPATIAPVSDEGERVDQAVLDRLLGYLGASERRELVGDYIRAARGHVKSAREAFAQADWRTLHRAAHTLASSSGTVGVLRVATLAREIELSKDPPSQEAVDELAREVEGAARTLAGRIGDPRSDAPKVGAE